MLDTVIADPHTSYPRLRTPGFIQSFGVLLALHPRTLRIIAASANVDVECAVPHAAVLGQNFPSLLDDPAAAEIRAVPIADGAAFQNPIPATISGRRFDIIMHAHDGLVIAELEPAQPGAAGRADLDRLCDAAIEGMMVPADFAALIEAAPTAIRAATGFDRVMLYRFDEAYRGQVIAESRRPGVDGFLGLHFPEADIGPPARALYEQNFCRYIPRIDSPLIPIRPEDNPVTGKPIDLTLSVLRGVAPCHTEYLQNMGVAASMSFSIVSEGRLWGLFACHHYQTARLCYTQRLVCEQIAMLFTARLCELVNPAAVEEQLAHIRARLLAGSPILHDNPISQCWAAQDEQILLDLVHAEGAAIYVEGTAGQIGHCPDLSPLHEFLRRDPEAFDRLVRLYDDSGLFYTNSAATATPFGEAMRAHGSGMLIVPLARSRRAYVIWFRPEQVLKANWAGNAGAVQDAPYRPRKSFAAWQEDIRDRASPWSELEIANALALRDAALARHH